MERRNSNILFAFLITICCFLAVVYTSCNKSDNSGVTCEGINCLNGGTCRNGKCVCPNGYEGKLCDVYYNAKYSGNWNVHEKIIASSNSLVGIRTDSLYSITIVPSSTNSTGLSSPTAFFIDSMLGNYKFANLSCVVDTLPSTSSSFFFQPNQFIGGGAMEVYSGWGNIDTTHNKITGTYVRNRLGSATTIYDTLSFTMTRQ